MLHRRGTRGLHMANAGCYGIYGELNRHQVGKNDAKQVVIFSGEANITVRVFLSLVANPAGIDRVDALVRIA
jgi:hypothetical protein